ncbi:hypothetical protein [Catenulispora yoronensis]
MKARPMKAQPKAPTPPFSEPVAAAGVDPGRYASYATVAVQPGVAG